MSPSRLRSDDVQTRQTGIVDFTFIPDFNPDMEITALDEPTLVAWTCVGGHDPWLNSTFRFEIEPVGGDRSRLMFRQGYGKPRHAESYAAGHPGRWRLDPLFVRQAPYA